MYSPRFRPLSHSSQTYIWSPVSDVTEDHLESGMLSQCGSTFCLFFIECVRYLHHTEPFDSMPAIRRGPSQLFIINPCVLELLGLTLCRPITGGSGNEGNRTPNKAH